jgi:hypothetical protein
MEKGFLQPIVKSKQQALKKIKMDAKKIIIVGGGFAGHSTLQNS